MFGWSYPPGCSGTPYDEDSAVEVEVTCLPTGHTAWWDEYGTISIQDNEGYDYKNYGPFEWDDNLSDQDNLAAAAAFIEKEYVSGQV